MPAGCRRRGGRSRQGGPRCANSAKAVSKTPQSPACGRLRACRAATQTALGTRPPLREAPRRRGAAADAQSRASAAVHSSDLATAMLVCLQQCFTTSQSARDAGEVVSPAAKGERVPFGICAARSFVVRLPFTESFSFPRHRCVPLHVALATRSLDTRALTRPRPQRRSLHLGTEAARTVLHALTCSAVPARGAVNQARPLNKVRVRLHLQHSGPFVCTSRARHVRWAHLSDSSPRTLHRQPRWRACSPSLPTGEVQGRAA